MGIPKYNFSDKFYLIHENKNSDGTKYDCIAIKYISIKKIISESGRDTEYIFSDEIGRNLITIETDINARKLFLNKFDALSELIKKYESIC